jgi:2-methylcitrate dehydratase PrpD
MSELGRLAGNVAAVESGHLPEPVLAQARLCLLDTLGCGLYGSTLPEGGRILSALARLGDGGAPAWGGAAMLARGDCALACGALAHMRELDDVHYSITHPGAVVVPALHALAWDREHTLGEVLTALVCGYETMVRISKASNFLAHRRLGWHATATLGPFAAAAACGRLLGLDARAMAWALGLAGSRTGGTWAFKADGSMSKRLHPGLAARDGLTAACLAQAGITGPEFVLEAEDGGFFRVASEGWELEQLNRDWGEAWAVTETEFKWYAACKAVHAPLEAARNIRLRTGRPAAEVAEVNVGVNSSALAMAGGMHQRDSVASAQLSIPYGVALGLCGREGTAADFETGVIADEELYRLAGKVQVGVAPDMEAFRVEQHKSAARVEVAYQDGARETEEVHDPKGHQGNPLSGQQVVEKFLKHAGAVVGPARSEALCEGILEGAPRIPARELFQLTAYGQGGRRHYGI